LHCPFCTTEETKVIDSRLVDEGSRVRRRRECIQCNERFTTYEIVELILPRIIKRDGKRCVFDEDKLRGGMLRALEKRPVSTEALDAAIQRVIHHLHTQGEREVSSQYVGELVINELKALDKVAYVRFASVYHSFQDVNAFHEEIQRLQEHNIEKK
jgi:transcriptional repressor NrdR